jgi:hypothetical protein
LCRVKPKANKGLHNRTFSRCKDLLDYFFIKKTFPVIPDGYEVERQGKWRGFPITDCPPEQRAIFLWKRPKNSRGKMFFMLEK